MGRRRVDLQEAAELLGISSDAVRKRAKRGTMPYETGADGKLYVWVDGGETKADTAGVDRDHRDELLEVLRDEVAHLRAQLEAERRAHAESRRIAYTLAQRVPQLEAPRETPGEPQTPSEESERDVQDRGEEAQEATERRSWWRTIFGE